MKSDLNKLYTYINDTYGFPTYLYIGQDIDELKKQVKKTALCTEDVLNECLNEMENGADGVTLTLTTEYGKQIHFIYLPQWSGTAEDYSTLSHELGHVAHQALSHRGWTDLINKDVFHGYLYLHDVLLTNFIKQINATLKKNKKTKR